tara:strand:+ start:30831 stop:30956 length:126 start_codon:yes stop_codon:yes gene_type:complete
MSKSENRSIITLPGRQGDKWRAIPRVLSDEREPVSEIDDQT